MSRLASSVRFNVRLRERFLSSRLTPVVAPQPHGKEGCERSDVPTTPSFSLHSSTTARLAGLMTHTPICQAPRFPASAFPADAPHQAEQDTPLAREVALLSRDDFGRRVFRFSRLNFDAQDRPAVHIYLSELLRHRIPTATPKQFQDYLHLASVAGFHELCVQLFEARRRAEEAGHVALIGSDSGVSPTSFVVDSAYALKDSRRLLHLAAVAARHVDEAASAASPSADLAADEAGDGTVPIASAQAIDASFALVRCLWRTVCLHCHFDNLASTSVSSVAAAHRADADQAAHDVLQIYTDYIIPLSARSHTTSRSAVHAEAAADPADSDTHNAAEPAMRDAARSQASQLPWEPARLLRRLRRIVLYDDSGDDGDMLFHQFCLSQGWLQPPGGALEKQTASQSMVREEAQSTARELFYSHLISTCTTGKHVGMAMAYYDAALAGGRHAAVLTSSSSTSPFASSAPFAPMTSSRGDAEKGCPSAASSEPRFTTDYVPWRLIIVLQAARDNRFVVRLSRRLLASGSPIGISVWSLILISAGEARAADLALHCLDLARRQLVLDGGGAAGVSGGGPLESAGGGLGDGGRHGWEYLLQTALNALSKCQVQAFELNYLAPAVEEGLLHCTDDFYYGCLLQEAHNALNPAERAEALLARMASRGVPLSAALIGRLLKLYLRVESAAFLPIYRHAVEDLGFYRGAWRDELLLWADRRRYMLTDEDRAYVLDQIAQHTPEPIRDHLGGLRTQYALLEYDARVRPLEVFARTHAPPSEAPTTMDSRMHFLLKKPQLVRRGVQRGGNDDDSAIARESSNGSATPWLVASSQRLLQAAEAVVLTREPLLTSTAGATPTSTSSPMVDDAYRLYLGELVEGLQRSRNNLP